MTLLNNKYAIIINIISPVILCLGLIYLIEKIEYFKYYSFYLIILVFGVSIILFNNKKTNRNFTVSLLFSVILCFLVFFLSMFIAGVFTYCVEKIFLKGLEINNNIILNRILNYIPVVIVSSLIMFYSYRLLFKIEMTNYFFIVKWVSVLIILVIGLTDFLNNYLLESWQFIMILALQLILNKDEIKNLLSSRKSN